MKLVFCFDICDDMLLPICLFALGNMYLINDLKSLKPGGVIAWMVEPSNMIPNSSIASIVNM